ncbi:hypothetical protein V8G54_031033 [Vigna mungo]|uniref:GDSL esterase/lipase n=1 Tax=Vigna mungo TaxID=3915 RepID=A0AAQ3MWU9_VIGMU
MATNTCTLQILSLIAICIPCAISFQLDFPAVFNFGDSNSDTGALIVAGFESLYPSNGQTYFQIPSERYFDGRDAMDLPFLNAYLDSLGLPNFRKGCNFATTAATILSATSSSLYPFSFRVQVSQFLRFKARALELIAKGICQSTRLAYSNLLRAVFHIQACSYRIDQLLFFFVDALISIVKPCLMTTLKLLYNVDLVMAH